MGGSFETGSPSNQETMDSVCDKVVKKGDKEGEKKQKIITCWVTLQFLTLIQFNKL